MPGHDAVYVIGLHSRRNFARRWHESDSAAQFLSGLAANLFNRFAAFLRPAVATEFEELQSALRCLNILFQ